ncbi:DUF6435 family protein [Moritella sp. Urea-trap-13]|uniref:DUF6435 family protein n=1 Tax=Moritella sp. Urea-trap-13 TaxID=2058327 RepID=UPI000C327A4C|nr:DUF6435 family protein [Moritella sp. Urea-trap-13]PKH06726.1 hypothetical protein CXF93_12595 [Moritella sp. Urea-trap-13]
MYSIFKRDPVKKLTKLYSAKLEQAMYAQRNGDIRAYSMLTVEAEKLASEIDALDSSIKNSPMKK